MSMNLLKGLGGLFESKKGWAFLALCAAATALTWTARLPVADWVDLMKWAFIGYVGAETVNGTMATWKGAPAPAAAPPAEEPKK